jgi:hypothetical protein
MQLQYLYVELRNCRVKNTSTRQGTGVKNGPKVNSQQCTWDQVLVADYATSFDLSMDHVQYKNCFAIRPTVDGFYMHAAGWCKFDNPYVLFLNPSSANGCHFDAASMTDVWGAGFENSTGQTGAMFNSTSTLGSNEVVVWSINSYETGFTVVGSGGAGGIRYPFNNSKYKGSNSGVATITFASQTSVTIPHGLFAIPTSYKAFARSANLLGNGMWFNADTTNITVTFQTALPASGTGFLGWEAAV